MKNLRSFIRKIVSEGMINPNSGEILQNYALYAANDYDSPSSAGVKIYILYNKTEVAERLSDKETIIDMFAPLIRKTVTGKLVLGFNDSGERWNWDDVRSFFWEIIYEHTYAIIKTKKNDIDCNGAVQVVRAAAKQGHGPTLYDIVMSIEPNGITSDRAQVSSSAREVYRFYAEKRPEIEKKYLDGGMLTDITSDDCYTYMTPKEMYKNSLLRKAVYEAFGDWLISYNREIYQALDNKGGFYDVVDHFGGPDDVIRYIIDSVEFGEMYDEGELSELQTSWYEEKEEIEKNLYKLKPPAILEPKEELNLSYNTDYAVSAFNKLTAAHDKFLDEMEMGLYYMLQEIYGREVPIDGMITDLKPSFWENILSDFFHAHYNGGK